MSIVDDVDIIGGAHGISWDINNRSTGVVDRDIIETVEVMWEIAINCNVIDGKNIDIGNPVYLNQYRECRSC